MEKLPKETLGELISKLQKLATLEDGWDSYNAQAPSKVAINNAIVFLISNAQTNLPFFLAAPGVNGDVLVEIKKDNRSAEIYFNPDHTDELFLYKNDECVKESNLKDGFSLLFDFFDG